ncbi:hypothetical protein OY671_006188, partial [Metschnikowia pulcherrima]
APAAAGAPAVTAPAAASHPAQPSHAQVTGPVVRLAEAGDGDHVLTLSVTPENLGPVTVRAHVAGGDSRIELYAPHDTGREASRAIVADSRRDSAGIAGGASSVTVADAGAPAAAVDGRDGRDGRGATADGSGARRDPQEPGAHDRGPAHPHRGATEPDPEPTVIGRTNPVPVEPVSAPAPASMYATKNTRTPKQEYDSELFLGLLVTQSRNQDPSSSMDTGEIVSQTTSLAMMEALTRMTGLVEESFALQMRQSAADLSGNTVSYLDADGVEHTGTATAVSYRDAVPTVTIGGVTVDLDHVSAVTSSVSTDATGTPAATDGATDDHGSSAA